MEFEKVHKYRVMTVIMTATKELLYILLTIALVSAVEALCFSQFAHDFRNITKILPTNCE